MKRIKLKIMHKSRKRTHYFSVNQKDSQVEFVPSSCCNSFNQQPV